MPTVKPFFGVFPLSIYGNKRALSFLNEENVAYDTYNQKPYNQIKTVGEFLLYSQMCEGFTSVGEERRFSLKNGNYIIARSTGTASDGGYTWYYVQIYFYSANDIQLAVFGGYNSAPPGTPNYYIRDGVPSAFALGQMGVGFVYDHNDIVRLFESTVWSPTMGAVYVKSNFDAGNFLNNAVFGPDPYDSIPDNENPGSGYGPYDYTSETDLPPSLPSASAAQCGFVSLWNPTITELQGLASYLWTSGLFDINTWRHLFSNPMDCILSVGIIPFVPDRALSKEEIIFCGTSHSAITAYRVPTQMYIIPMGTMHITGMSGGYTDYEPYAKASLFLPYCGTYALSCDEIVDADLSLEYHVDIYTGACVAYLTIERTNSNGEQVNAVMYQFTGNMLSTIPVTGADHSNFIQSLLFMGAAIGATVATSGAAAPEIGGAMAAGDAVAGSTALTAATAGSAINTVMSMKPNVMRSGNLSSNAGLLGKQAPTITMTWSNICRPEDEYKLAGMPLHKSGTLSDFSGFTVVSAVHMDNILCTEEEKTIIEELLYKGVII